MHLGVPNYNIKHNPNYHDIIEAMQLNIANDDEEEEINIKSINSQQTVSPEKDDRNLSNTSSRILISTAPLVSRSSIVPLKSPSYTPTTISSNVLSSLFIRKPL